MKTWDRIDELTDKSNDARSLLRNHTEFITKIKKQLEDFVTWRKFDELTKTTKLLARNEELKALYDKVVPPAAQMFEMAKEMEAEVNRMDQIVQNFDKNLSIKASR